MERKLIKFVATSIHRTGIKIFQEETFYFEKWKMMVFVIVPSVTVTPSSVMYMISNRYNIDKALDSLPYSVISFVILGSTIITIYQRQAISEMLHQMDRVYMYPDDVLLEEEPQKWYQNESYVVRIIRAVEYLKFALWFIYFSPYLILLYTDGITDGFTYPLWFPWSLNNPTSQHFIVVIQAFSSFCMLICFHNIDLCLLVAYADFKTQYEKLIRAVESIKDRTIYHVLNTFIHRDRYDELMRENIIHCVKHHQTLYKSFRSFDVWFQMYFSWILAIYLITSSITLYVATTASSFFAILSTVQIFVYMSFMCFNPCIIGEMFSDLNQKLANAIFYDTGWYETTRENRRLLVIFHALACRPLHLKGFGGYRACYEMFGGILDSTYSNFNTLRDIFGKNK